MNAFISSHIDYCSSLLYGSPSYQINKLQIVQNAAARLVCKVPKFHHITPTLLELHWLPVKFWIEFKILLLTFNSLVTDPANIVLSGTMMYLLP